MSASLVLEDGTEITGKQFGANKSVAGEVGKLLFYFKYVCRDCLYYLFVIRLVRPCLKTLKVLEFH